MEGDRTSDLVKLYIKERGAVLDNFPKDQVIDAAGLVANTYFNDGTVFTCGNGGGSLMQNAWLFIYQIIHF